MTTQRLSRWTKLIYGAGDTGFSLTSTILGLYFAIYLTDVVGLSPGVAGTAILVGRVWDFVNDPLIGHISDRTRSRWGRRRPYLLFGAIPFGIAFTLLWWKPPLTSQLALAAYYAVAYLLFDTAATFAYMPYFALTPEIAQDYDERTALTSYRMFFSILGGLIAVLIPIALIGTFRPENANRVTLMGVIFAAASVFPLWLTFFGTREREQHMQQDRPALKKSIQAAFKNQPFLFSAGLFLLTWVAVNILETTLLFYIKYVVEREPQTDLIMGVIFITAILTLPLWEYISRRWNKQRAYIAGIGFWAVIQMVLISLSPASPLSLLIGLSVLAGVGVGAAHVLPWSIIPDAIEWDELHTGERHEGMFYSLVTLLQKIASAIAIPLVLYLLEATNYVANAAVQSPSALIGIRIVVGPVSSLLLFAGIIFAWRYPLNRENYAQIQEQIKSRRDTD